MAKKKTQYVCQKCGAVTLKWMGQCPECSEWNCLEETLIEIAPATKQAARFSGYAGNAANILLLQNVAAVEESRIFTGISELDRVLGGGRGIGSDPPCVKSASNCPGSRR